MPTEKNTSQNIFMICIVVLMVTNLLLTAKVALVSGVISVSLHEIILFRWYLQLWPAHSA